MTLVSRNRIIRTMGIFSTILFAWIIISYAFMFFSGNFPILEYKKRFLGNLLNFFLFEFNIYAVFLAVAFLLLYVPICCFGMLHFFEKTQIPELLYFSLFLLNFIPESSRLLIPLFSNWQSYPHLMIFLSKIILFSRISASLSMLAIASLASERNDTNSSTIQISILALCAILVCFVPVNTIQMLSTAFASYAYYGFSLCLRLGFYAITAISFWLTGYKMQAVEYKRCAINYLILIFGELFLQECDNCIFLLFGITFLYGGTFFFFKNLHKYYMWK